MGAFKLALILCLARVTLAFECAEDGLTADEHDPSCRRYIRCEAGEGSFVECPEGSAYDANSMECVNEGDYECPNELPLPILFARALPASFQCTEAGRYEDVKSPNCRGYYLCVKKSDNTFAAYAYNCTAGQAFNPTTKACDPAYACLRPFTCTTEGIFPDPQSMEPCRSFVMCVALPDLSIKKYNRDCTSPSFFNPTTKKCEATYACPAPIIPFACAADGRFPDTSVADCRGYVICLADGDGAYDPVHRLCANTSRFNPKTQKCEASYACGSSAVAPFVCPTEGAFPDADVAGCVAYVVCLSDGDGVYVQQPRLCPGSETFNPYKRQCEAGFVCGTADSFACAADGRYPDPDLTDCRGYVICQSGVQPIRKLCTDPVATFDPATKKCSTSHVCNPPPPPFKCTAAGRFPLPQPSDCKSYVLCIEDADGAFEARRMDCTVPQLFNPTTRVCDPAYTTCGVAPPHVCTAAGSYPDLTIPGCTSSVTCIPDPVAPGVFIREPNTCPIGERFNPASEQCDPAYVCPTARRRRSLSVAYLMRFGLDRLAPKFFN